MFMGDYSMGFGSFYMIFIWLLLGASVVVLLKSFFAPGKLHDKKSRSLEILKQRYANGEIDSEQFLKMKDDLSVH